jgi:formamidase
VKVRGAGVYLGDMHAGQGDGEIAGHTMDVAGSVTLQVEVVKNYPIDGPVLFPLEEDLPPMARPFTAAEKAKGLRLAAKWGVTELEPLAPVSVVGTASNLNAAIENGLARAATLLGMTVAEVRNRATINGAIEIGRAPGVIQVTFLAPLARLDAVGLGDYAREQYGL